MRLPGRLHITWENDNVLKVETDAGTQTRLFRFAADPSASGAPTLQGNSLASWDIPGGGRGGRSGGGLSVQTTNMRAGYLRKNGVPYSASAVLKEFYDVVKEAGDQYLVVTTIVEDPKYLQQPFITSSHFRKQSDATGWHPSLCTAD
jgi:hypothetical protein